MTEDSLKTLKDDYKLFRQLNGSYVNPKDFK